MSRFLTCLALGASFCTSFLTVALAGEQETAARPLPSAGQVKILAALSQPTEFDFEARPLVEVMNHFKQKHQIEMLLDNRALTDAGLGTHTPITAALRKISLRSALRLILGQLDLAYVLRDGYLLITSKREAEGMLNCKVYPVLDLVTLDSAFRPAPPKRTERDDSVFVSEAFVGGPFFGPAKRETGDFQSLIDLITSTVAPTTWDEVGGPGAIRENANSQAIAVSQTDDAHDEIVALFAALRRVRDEQIAAAQPLVVAAPPVAIEVKQPLKVHAYRLMRGTVTPGKSGWRPPVRPVGDVRPPRSKQSSDSKSANADTADPIAQPKPKDETLAALAEKMASLVPQMIEPQSWEPSGEGMIRAVGEGLVVRQTEEVQRRVAGLLAELLPDCVPLGFTGPWGPWRAAGTAAIRLRPASTANWPQQAAPRPCGPETGIYQALREKCDVEFNELPLADALRPLAKPSQVQVYVDQSALADAGVGTDTPITCSVKGLTYGAALKLLLRELDLTYLIRDEVLFITSKTEAEGMLSTQVYPVFDLVARPSDTSDNRPALDFQSLIDSITNNIAPTTWDEVGGPGAIREFVNSAALVISQTTEVHEEIAEYLRAMREVGAAQKTSQ